MLGTGTPRPDPARAGPATALVVADAAYLVDFGAGVIRRATDAYDGGVNALGYGGTNISVAFLTHMHSDHTLGYPDLILTPWLMGRSEPLTVYGPRGITTMTEHILEAWQIDIDTRLNGPAHYNATGCKVRANEISPGVVHKDRNVTVTAFAVQHETAESFGYRFDTQGRSIVISGDTSPTQVLVDHSRGCDVLVHEVYSMDALRRDAPQFQEFRRRYHTSSVELAAIANEVNPGLLVLYHRANRAGGSVTADMDAVLLSEIRATYKGEVVAARDLDVF
jgi:ribonuclease BN (tRNA processing enzyme)